MANYSTLLNTWGDTGTEYPNGYSYIAGEQPVDSWDNYITYNIIEDLNHLIGLTNSRIETDSGAAGSEPTSPELSHLFHDQDNESLHLWDSTASEWKRLLAADGDTLGGALDFAGYAAQNVGSLSMSGSIDVAGQNITDGAMTVYDATTGKFKDADTVDGQHASDLGSGASNNGTQVVSTATDFNFTDNLQVTDDGDGTVSISAVSGTDTHTAVSEDGTELVSSVDDIDFTGHLNVIDDGDGTVTIDPTHNHSGNNLIPKSVSVTEKMKNAVYPTVADIPAELEEEGAQVYTQSDGLVVFK